MEQTSKQTEMADKHAVSVIRKEEEGSWLRDEILKQIDWQQPLLLAVFFGGGTFLSLGLQPNVSGLTAMVFPIAALALALKLSAHDLRTGQINFYLRYVLRSPWEIVRRRLFNGKSIDQGEQRVLEEQGIVITSELLEAAQKLKSPIADFTFEAASLGIGVIRTYPEALHHDLLTLFVWFLSALATFLTIVVLRRRRVR